MTTPSLRPLGTGELLDRTFSLYRSHFLLFAGIAAVTQLPLALLQLAGLTIVPQQGAGLPTAAGCGMMLLWFLATMVTTLAVTAATQGATVVGVSHVYLVRSITVSGALGAIRGRIVGLAVTMIVVGLVAFLAFLLLIVPGVIVSLAWALTIPVAVLEERSMLDAASRSSELTKGSRLRVALVYVLFVLIMLVVSIALGFFVGLITYVTQGSWTPVVPTRGLQVANVISSYLSQCLAAPLMTIGLSLLYYDLRVRKEAYDLELMMAAIDGRESETTTA